ncbi:zinc metalloproteinase-disintegrin-like VLAIP-B [Mantella aurantiaca]
MLGAAILLLALLHCQTLAINRLPRGLKYEVVFPEKIHSWHKRDTESKYPTRIQYKLNVEGYPVHLHLEKTERLLAENYTETTYLANGTRVTTSPENQDHCCYQGYVKQDVDSLVTLCTCNGLSGLIHTRKRRFVIEPLNKTDDGEHAIYEDKEETPKTCGVTNTSYTEGKVFKSSRSGNNAEKQNFLNSQKYVQLYLVADKTMCVKYNYSTEVMRQRFFEIVNYVNEVNKQIGTFVALVGLEFWNKEDMFVVSTSAGKNLDQFCNWKKKDLLPRQYHNNAQFVTNTDFDGATVGLAYVGTICSETHSCGVIQDHSRNAISVGATVAHEMGHNLGMNHDTSSCSCSGDSCIMAPSLSYNTPRLFSSCSVTNFKDFIFSQMPACMKKEPSKEYIESPSVCGNKFTEIGEDCDCGTEKECTNPCCDAATCKFKDNAKCAEGECCENCMIMKAGTVCRPVKDECDIADMCNGNSPECPTDSFIYNGHPCNDGKGYCYNGKCPSLEGQCIELWNAGASVAADGCFRNNQRGTNFGYCQYINNNYVPCGQDDIKCGVLYCSGGSANPTINAGFASLAACRAVLHPSGMVKNGTMCGKGMVCYNAKCVSINSAFRSVNCSASCPGHGVCDHELQCRCQEGWAPPYCDSTSDTNIVLIVVVILIALALIVGLVLMVVFRKKFKRCGQKSPSGISGATNPVYVNQKPQKKTGSSLSPPQPQGKAGYWAPQYSVTTSVELSKNSPVIQRPATAPPPVPATAPPPVPVTAPPPVPVTAPPLLPVTKPVPKMAPPPVPVSKPVPATAPPHVPATKPVPAMAPPPVPATKPVLPTPPTKALKPPVKK